MHPKKLTAADAYDTWEAQWEDRLCAHVRSLGPAHVWDYVRSRPGTSYTDLAEELAAGGGFGVAPIQVERLQVRDTPAAELEESVRDSLCRHLRVALRKLAWGEGPYWESRAIGALASWASMWSERVDLSHHKTRLFDLRPPDGWVPADPTDAYLMVLVPSRQPSPARTTG